MNSGSVDESPEGKLPEFEELPPMLSPLVLARFLAVSPKTLERWRKDRTGPTPRQLPGSNLWRYARSDVVAWLEASRTDR